MAPKTTNSYSELPYRQAPQLQSTQIQSDSSEIQVLEQSIREAEFENHGLKAMIAEQREEYARQKAELEAARDKIIQLKARSQQLEQQK